VAVVQAGDVVIRRFRGNVQQHLVTIHRGGFGRLAGSNEPKGAVEQAVIIARKRK